MITIRYFAGTASTPITKVFPLVAPAAEWLETIRRSDALRLVDIAATPRVLGALALACPSR